MIITLSFFLLLVYSLTFIFLTLHWKKITVDFKNFKDSVSVIVPIRNEEKNILNIISDLSNQKYDDSLLEIIIVNDHSQDKTLKILKDNDSAFNFKLCNLKKNQKGKKQALLEGVRNSNGNILLFLDGDCRVKKEWIANMILPFKDLSISMVCAPVIFFENSFFDKIQNLEFISLVGTSAAAIAMNRAVFCNGANLAVRKIDFIKNKKNINSHISSGDDVFLMHSLKRESKKSIKFLKSHDVTVTTKASTTFLDFFNQRKRWSKKSLFYKDADTIFLGSIVLFSNFCLMILIINSILTLKFSVTIFFFIVKFMVDIYFLFDILNFFNKIKLLKYLFILEIIYCFYVPFIALISFYSKFEWKGRVLNK